jgi:quinol monooxygenase YgiN
MSIRRVLYIEALPGKVEQIKTAYAESCPEVRVQPGCLEYELYQSIERPDQFALLERWADEQAMANHGNLVVHRGLDLDTVRRIVSIDRHDAP